MLDAQSYNGESETVRCSLCGAKVSNALAICPICGQELQAQRRSWSTTAIFITLLALCSLILALYFGGEGSLLRRGLRVTVDRLDQLATRLDPRLVVSATPESIADLLGLPTATVAITVPSDVAGADLPVSSLTSTTQLSNSRTSEEVALAIATTLIITPLSTQSAPLLPQPTATNEPTATGEPTGTALASATETQLATNTPLASNTPVATQTSIATSIPVATNTSPATATPAPTETEISVPQATATRKATPTDLPTQSPPPTITSSTSLALLLPTPTPLGEVESASLTTTQSTTATTIDTPSPVATATPVPTHTALPTATVTATDTPTPVATATSVPTNTALPIATFTTTATPTPVATATPVPTHTALATATFTHTTTPTPIATATLAATDTLVPTPTPVPTETATPSPLIYEVIYEVKAGDTLIRIAAQYDILLDDLLAANGFSGVKVPVIRPGQRLIIPGVQVVMAVPTATQALVLTATTQLLPTPLLLVPTATPIVPATVVAQTYTVQPGDTPLEIAGRYGVSVDQLLRANGLTRADATRIRPGQVMVIPGTSAASSEQAPTAVVQTQSYVIQTGDTPLAIAQRYGISVDLLLQANGLSRADATRIRPGQTLVIPLASSAAIATAQSLARATATAAPPLPTLTSAPAQTYVVQSGDTPNAIAARFGVNVDTMLAANGLTRADATRLRPGQTLVIPGGRAVPISPAATRPAQPATGATNGGVRLDAPQLLSPENGTTVSCGTTNSLTWQPVAFMRETDRFLVHLGYVSNIDAAGNTSVTWVLAQERTFNDPQWIMDNNLCGLTPANYDRRWLWYVEVIDTTAGGQVVSAPAPVWGFRWE